MTTNHTVWLGREPTSAEVEEALLVMSGKVEAEARRTGANGRELAMVNAMFWQRAAQTRQEIRRAFAEGRGASYAWAQRSEACA